jgi:hypothetical protein
LAAGARQAGGVVAADAAAWALTRSASRLPCSSSPDGYIPRRTDRGTIRTRAGKWETRRLTGSSPFILPVGYAFDREPTLGFHYASSFLAAAQITMANQSPEYPAPAHGRIRIGPSRMVGTQHPLLLP